jgi:hypothetical protein
MDWKFSFSIQPAAPLDSLVVQYTMVGDVVKLKQLAGKVLIQCMYKMPQRGRGERRSQHPPVAYAEYFLGR